MSFTAAGWIFHNNSAFKARNYFYCLYSCTGDPDQRAQGSAEPVRRNDRRSYREEQALLLHRLGADNAPARRNGAADRAHRRDAHRRLQRNRRDDIRSGYRQREWNRPRTPFPNNIIPANRVDPASAYMQNLIPAPNQPVFPNNYLAVGRYTADRDNVDFKVNYNPNEKLQLFTRYSFSPTEFFDPPSLGEAGGDATGGGQPGRAPGLIQTAGIGGTYAFSPTYAAGRQRRLHAAPAGSREHRSRQELRAGRTEDSGHQRTGPAASRLSADSRSTPFRASVIRTSRILSSFAIRSMWRAQTSAVIKGAHSMRFGFEYSKYSINHFQPQASQRAARRLHLQRRPDFAQRRRRRRRALTAGRISCSVCRRRWARTFSI